MYMQCLKLHIVNPMFDVECLLLLYIRSFQPPGHVQMLYLPNLQ